MAKKKNPVSEYLAKIGKRGGAAKVAKGFSQMDPERRAAIAKKAAKKRWADDKKQP